MLTHCAGDGGKKARSPERARSKPLKPFAQGMLECFGEPVVTTRMLSTFAYEAAGAHKHPAFPAPSVYGGIVFAKLGQDLLRECGGVSWLPVRRILRDARRRRAPQDEARASLYPHGEEARHPSRRSVARPLRTVQKENAPFPTMLRIAISKRCFRIARRTMRPGDFAI
jgi:hypothetical protein